MPGTKLNRKEILALARASEGCVALRQKKPYLYQDAQGNCRSRASDYYDCGKQLWMEANPEYIPRGKKVKAPSKLLHDALMKDPEYARIIARLQQDIVQKLATGELKQPEKRPQSEAQRAATLALVARNRARRQAPSGSGYVGGDFYTPGDMEGSDALTQRMMSLMM